MLASSSPKIITSAPQLLEDKKPFYKSKNPQSLIHFCLSVSDGVCVKKNVNGNGEEMVFVKRLAKNYFSLSNNTFNCNKR